VERIILLTPWWLSLLAGLALGSFANVLIHRLPQGLSLWRPASRCPACQRPIKAWENIPLVSWMLLRGRCAGCGWSIPWRYPLVEALCAVLALSVAWRLPLSLAWLVWLPVVPLLVALAFIDLDTQRLPNTLTLPLALLGLAGGGLSWLGGGEWTGQLPSPLESLLGLLAGGGSLWAFAWLGWLLFKRESLGAGDVKLMAALGLLLGWKGSLLAIFLAALGGAAWGIAQRRGRHAELPFGPWLALGSWIAFLWSDTLLSWYLDLVL